jgi:GNAT superfamily N-acetyltransferase
LKRVWTRRDLRRQGLARRLTAELEAHVLRQGYARIYLTTGFRQPEAKNLYLANGYTALFDVDGDLEALGHLPFEKRLVASIPKDQPAEAAE